MILKRLEISGFKSFAKKTVFTFDTPISAIVGPNGSGKSNVAEGLRWVLGEQSMKSLRGKKGEDLIFNGSKSASRMSRASVTIVFDNSEKIFNVDFDEVVISREVHRDGVNKYTINGSPVRLKDIYELLSVVSLGASGHHIISQGETDRILNANIKDRKTMIEDALGLKIYQYKKQESQRKLEKTEANIKEVESLRREIAPQIKFLKKQVDQIEKVREMRSDLKTLHQKYFSHEEGYLKEERKRISREEEDLRKQLLAAEEKLTNSEEEIKKSDKGEEEKTDEVKEIEGKLFEVRQKKDELSRNLGRIEGVLEAKVVSVKDYIEVTEAGEKKCRFCGQVVVSSNNNGNNNHAEIDHLKKEKQEINDKLLIASSDEKTLREKLEEVKTDISKSFGQVRQAERLLFDLKTERNEIRSKIEQVGFRKSGLLGEEEDFQREINEAQVLAGREALDYSKEVSDLNSRSAQKDLRKKIERIKIRIEDSGAGGEDVVKEFEEVSKREEFLSNEVEDLEKSAEALKKLLTDLEEKLEDQFKGGLEKINKEFQKFFEILFGGGTAALSIAEEKKRKRTMIDPDTDEAIEIENGTDQDGEWGIEIKVSLPRKKIRGLEMLSGGERALTSIALLFAMSQVNPPPFLVLDETDAALDEANSRKYGDMIESLAKKSQLILITHNRETMSRAGVLYGVTMSADSISQLLSVKFDEALSYAKA